MDDWGPYDFASPKIWPARIDAWEEARFEVFGAPGSVEVAALPPALEAELKDSHITVRFAGADATGSCRSISP